MKIGLLQVFGYVTTSAICLAALVNSNFLMMVTIVTLTICFILAGVCNVVRANQRDRTFWLFFVLISTSYLIFAYIPDRNGRSPRLQGSEFTTKFLRATYQWLGSEVVMDTSRTRQLYSYSFCMLESPQQQQESEDSTGGQEQIEPDKNFQTLIDMVNEQFPSEETTELPFAVNSAGFGVFLKQQEYFRNFMRIGHHIFALIFGWTGGWLASIAVLSSQNRSNS